MSVETDPPFTPSPTMRRGSKILSGALILVFVAGMALYILLPMPWPDILMGSLMIGGTVLIAGLFFWSWQAWRQSGTVLLNLGRTESLLPSLILVGLLGAVSWYTFLANERHEIYRLVQGIFWCSVAAWLFYNGRKMTLITDKGWYGPRAAVPWDNIAAFHWKAFRNECFVLELRFQHPKNWSNNSEFLVPMAHKVAVEELLAQHFIVERNATQAEMN